MAFSRDLGYVCLIKPLTPGIHTVNNYVEDNFFWGASWEETRTITVIPWTHQLIL
ncbi:MAG TPA: hypothetical protein P5525_08135 [Candidatus Paceibacterota bacterium]|nr:hypothetical protein [Candidatus Paceibacterota bacterium]